MAAIDLYSGIGGWTLGFKLAGIPVLSSYEWWKDANRTHNKNFGSDHTERNIRELDLKKDLPEPGTVDFVVGSPPCTQFSLSNRGGKGDIKDGLIDIRKFLEVVEYLKPKYWAMENVPRVAKILEQKLKKGQSLYKFRHLFKDIKVYTSSDFGVPQDRKRMIAGNLPFDLLESYIHKIPKLNLGDVVSALDQPVITDPIYGITLKAEEMTDHVPETKLSVEETRINSETKTHHPVYNRMSFPDRLDRPSRTITAVCTRVSRESIIIKDLKNNIRRLTVRERGLIQSFPINYQYFGSSYNNKIKMIGNAIPPVLTFYIAQAMQEVSLENLQLPGQVQDRLILHSEPAVSSKPDSEGGSYPWTRSFWMAIQGLRFGSGVRFELRNAVDKETQKVEWKVRFHYGNSKKMKEKQLDAALSNKITKLMKTLKVPGFGDLMSEYKEFLEKINSKELQQNWTHQDRSFGGPIELVDKLSEFVGSFKKNLKQDANSLLHISDFIELELKNEDGTFDNKKISQITLDIFLGMLLGTSFNIADKQGKKAKLRTVKEAA
jgi:DNA (cytosine-5)-methyltransferase 1